MTIITVTVISFTPVIVSFLGKLKMPLNKQFFLKYLSKGIT